jgi:hypothetical protein
MVGGAGHLGFGTGEGGVAGVAAMVLLGLGTVGGYFGLLQPIRDVETIE